MVCESHTFQPHLLYVIVVVSYNVVKSVSCLPEIPVLSIWNFSNFFSFWVAQWLLSFKLLDI